MNVIIIIIFFKWVTLTVGSIVETIYFLFFFSHGRHRIFITNRMSRSVDLYFSAVNEKR